MVSTGEFPISANVYLSGEKYRMDNFENNELVNRKIIKGPVIYDYYAMLPEEERLPEYEECAWLKSIDDYYNDPDTSSDSYLDFFNLFDSFLDHKEAGLATISCNCDSINENSFDTSGTICNVSS